MSRLYLGPPGLTCALGCGLDATRAALLAGDTSGLRLEDGWLPDRPVRVGRLRNEPPPLPDVLPLAWRSRNNAVLLAAAQQIAGQIDAARRRYGAGRIGVVLGTSTSGIAEAELAFHATAAGGHDEHFVYPQMELGAPASFLAEHLELDGPAYTVSTACTSGAKALASARNLIRSGLVDVVIAGGVDSLCRLTLRGFTALESTSVALTNPLSIHRQGINIGEGAALFLLGPEAGPEADVVELLGIGESSDAYHMSAPEPEGRGAELALRAALADAGCAPEDIGYLNLHATATRKNDEMESRVVARVFPAGVPASGTKPLTGHTLGAAGALEAAFCWLALTGDGRLPPHVWDGQPDPELPQLALVRPGDRFAAGQPRRAMSNSFAFGGNNISLILGARA